MHPAVGIGHAERSIGSHPQPSALVSSVAQPIEKTAVLQVRIRGQPSDLPLPDVAVGLRKESTDRIGLLAVDTPIDASLKHPVRSELVGKNDPAFAKRNLLRLQHKIDALLEERTNSLMANETISERQQLQVGRQEVPKDPPQRRELLAGAERPSEALDRLDLMRRFRPGDKQSADTASKPAPPPGVQAKLRLHPEAANEPVSK